MFRSICGDSVTLCRVERPLPCGVHQRRPAPRGSAVLTSGRDPMNSGNDSTFDFLLTSAPSSISALTPACDFSCCPTERALAHPVFMHVHVGAVRGSTLIEARFPCALPSSARLTFGQSSVGVGSALEQQTGICALPFARRARAASRHSVSWPWCWRRREAAVSQTPDRCAAAQCRAVMPSDSARFTSARFCKATRTASTFPDLTASMTGAPAAKATDDDRTITAAAARTFRIARPPALIYATSNRAVLIPNDLASEPYLFARSSRKFAIGVSFGATMC